MIIIVLIKYKYRDSSVEHNNLLCNKNGNNQQVILPTCNARTVLIGELGLVPNLESAIVVNL